MENPTTLGTNQGLQEEACADCGARKATAHDIIRWRSGARRDDVCFAGLERGLKPDEETADADFLRARLVEVRRGVDAYGCAVNRRRAAPARQGSPGASTRRT